MRARARYARTAALGGAAALAVLTTGITLTASSAVAAPSPKKFDFADDGKIIAKGAATKIKFTYTCPKGWEGSAGVTIVEAIGDGFASGYGGKALKCTGAQQNETFFVQANVYDGSKPFQPGEASIVATLDAWNPADSGCGMDGAPCPVDAPMAAAPGGKGALAVAVEDLTDAKMKPATNLHREFNGVITLK